MISLSETAFKITHATYNIPNYNIEMNYYREKLGGGVSLYIHSTVQYRTIMLVWTVIKNTVTKI